MKFDRTKIIYLSYKALCCPLESLFAILIFILSKEFEVSTLQLTLLACVRSISSLFAFNISATVVGKPHKLHQYLFLTTFIGAIPCLFFPFVDNIWFFIIAYTLFLTMSRAVFPPWMEILKTNLGIENVGKMAAIGTSLHYVLVVFIPLLLSGLMDQYVNLWKVLFSLLAILQIVSAGIIFFLKIHPSQPSFHFSSSFLSPWKGAWRHLKENPRFAKFQALFFLGGVGLILMQPILPIFFKESLQLSYVQLTLAFSLCKGIAIVCTSSGWAYLANKTNLYRLNSLVNAFSCLFITCLLASDGDIMWLYLAYLMYGAMQAGCELSWNIAGPAFAKEKESTLYSSETLALVGLRGCAFPFLGQLIFNYTNIFTVFTLAGLLCFSGILYGIWLEHEETQEQPV